MLLYPDRLAAQLGSTAKSGLPSAVLVAGEETLIVEEACDAIRAAAREAGYTEREVLHADARYDWAQLGAASASLSLFASRRIVEVRLAGAPGLEGAKAFAAWCADPAPDTLLLVISGARPDRKAKWSKCFEDDGWFVPVYALRSEELPRWIAARMRNRRLQPTDDAIARLAELMEGNLLAAAQEIDKLALLVGDARLDAAAVDRVVADSARYDPFQLLEATVTGQPERALRMLAGLKAEGESPVPLVIIMSREFRNLAELAAQVQSGASISSLTERIWPEQRRKPTQVALTRGSLAFWRRAVQRAARADQIAKGQIGWYDKRGVRSAPDPWQELTALVAGISMARGRRRTAA